MPRPPPFARLVTLALILGQGACVSAAHKDRAEARVDLGSAYLREGNAPGAVGVLREAAELDSGNWNAWNKLGLAYLAQGALAESERALKKATRLNPSAEVRNNYGYMLMVKGDMPAAIHQFELALTDLTYRKPALVLNNLGHALFLDGRNEEAILRLNEAVQRAPNLCQARFNRGLAEAALNQHEKALDDFETVISLCGEDGASGAYYQAARLLAEKDDRSGACTYLRTVMTDVPRTDLGDAASDLHARICL